MRCLGLTLVFAATVLLAACGGDDGESSATPALSPAPAAASSRTVGATPSAPLTAAPAPLESPAVPVTAAPDLRLCSADELSVAFVRGGVATGTSYPTYGINNNGDSACGLSGPPALRFEDSAGTDLAITYRRNLPCSSTAEQFCVLYGTLALQPTDLAPAQGGPLPSAAVVVAIAGTGYYQPCESPNVFASTLVFAFPEVGELQVPLDGWELQQCETQVSVYSFK